MILHALTSLPPSQVPPSLLVVAHKSDLLKATAGNASASQLAINRVKTVLERELEKRRLSQSGERLSADDEQIGGLECTGGVFKFDEWEGGEIRFIGTHVADDGLEPLLYLINDTI